MASYSFPVDKLARTVRDDGRQPLVLISCGSFSPITYLHLRLFEMAKDWVHTNTAYEVVGGYFSPVSDAYNKKGLVKAQHRIEMCRLASQNSSWITVDPWEASKAEYTRTAFVLDHFAQELEKLKGGISGPGGAPKKARVALLSGADLLLSMSEPGVWAEKDIEYILVQYGAFIIERFGTSLESALGHLQKWREHIYTVPQTIPNDISSTKVRDFLSKSQSVKYLLPDEVLDYISLNQLYTPNSEEMQRAKGPALTIAQVES